MSRLLKRGGGGGEEGGYVIFSWRLNCASAGVAVRREGQMKVFLGMNISHVAWLKQLPR